VTSALEVFLKWYTLYKSTFYLLTYLLTYRACEALWPWPLGIISSDAWNVHQMWIFLPPLFLSNVRRLTTDRQTSSSWSWSSNTHISFRHMVSKIFPESLKTHGVFVWASWGLTTLTLFWLPDLIIFYHLRCIMSVVSLMDSTPFRKFPVVFYINILS